MFAHPSRMLPYAHRININYRHDDDDDVEKQISHTRIYIYGILRAAKYRGRVRSLLSAPESLLARVGEKHTASPYHLFYIYIYTNKCRVRGSQMSGARDAVVCACVFYSYMRGKIRGGGGGRRCALVCCSGISACVKSKLRARTGRY